MSELRDETLRRALRAALPPTSADEPSRDLWPQVLARIATAPARVPRLDWALLAAAGAWLILFPESVVVLLYHL